MIDLLVYGNIITMDEAMPRAEAMAVKDGKIVYVGNRREAGLIKAAKTVGLADYTILPGFIDTHVHVIPAGIFMNGADLSKAGNIEEVLSVLAEHAKDLKKNKWLIAAYFQDKNIEEHRFPTKDELDSVSKDIPILICHNDLHPLAFNSKAISILKLDPNKDGVKTDENGELTGMVEDPACVDMLGDILAKLGIANILRGIMKVDDYAAAHGVTTVFGKDVIDILKLRELTKELYKVEFVPMWYSNGCKDIDSINDILKDKSLKDRACICAFADGAFDGHSAALNEPYSDRPDTYGIYNYTDDEMYEFTMAAHKAGQQVSFHAIGDAAIDQVLRVYERVLSDLPKEDHRLRIEHFEEPTPEAIEKAAELGVALSMQPLLIEVCEGMDFSGYETFIGERVKRCSPYRSILDAGLLVGGGTDFPVTPMEVLHGAQVALSHPVESERITLDEYLKMNTVNAAKLGFLEKRKGAIKPGLDADFVVLDADPYEVPVGDLSEIKILETYRAGQKIYDSRKDGRIKKEREYSIPGMLGKLVKKKIAKRSADL